MDLLDSAVAYDGLPISSGGAHGLGRISARRAFDAWSRFLDTRTQGAAIKVWFEFPNTPGLAVDPDVRQRVLQAFPGPIEPGRAQEALALFESLEPLPINPWGMAPVWLRLSSGFELLRPHGREVWPGQDPAQFGEFVTPGGLRLGASSSQLILEAKRSIGLSLSLPEATDAEVADFVPWLQADLPMRLSSKQWTRWTLTRNRQCYRGRKLVLATPTWRE